MSSINVSAAYSRPWFLPPFATNRSRDAFGVVLSQFDDQVFGILAVNLDILISVGVYYHPCCPDHVIKRIVCMSMDPQVGSVVKDIAGKVGHESAIKAVTFEPLIYGLGRNAMMRNNDSSPRAGILHRVKNIPLGFVKKIHCVFRENALAGCFPDDDEVIHVLASVSPQVNSPKVDAAHLLTPNVLV